MKRSLLLAIAFVGASPAYAQSVDLAAMSVQDVRPEVQRRYDEALSATLSATVLSAVNSSYMWASEAKVQCGIAQGFLKSNIRDADSLSKCERFHRMINNAAPTESPAMPEPPQPPGSAACNGPFSATLYFDWNSVTLPADSGQTIDYIVANKEACRWTSFSVIGHADRSGSDGYNQSLSIRRANAVGELMKNSGLGGSVIDTAGKGESEPRVQTADGERNPTNRRVEVSAK